MTPEEQQAAMMAANMDGQPRAFLGRQGSGASELVLRDGAGRARLVLSVAADGGARITFRDENGQPTRVVTPEG
ncbi:hypothetical protein D3C85_1765170 [compost metagenome]